MVPKQLHVTHLPCRNGEEFSLIIPNVSTQGPPTSSAVQVNPGAFSFRSFTENIPANRVRNATTSGYVHLKINQSRLSCQIRAVNWKSFAAFVFYSGSAFKRDRRPHPAAVKGSQLFYFSLNSF